MKSVTICVTNYQSGDTMALCIESIKKFTAYPHEILVYDDATDPGLYDDLTYLRDAQDKGWIRLIEGEERVMHGKGVARLLDAVTTDLAMILDCDIQVFRAGWLEKMVTHQEATGAALISDIEVFPDNVAIASWFFMLDMVQYPFVQADWGYTQKVPGDASAGMYPTGHQIYKRILDQGRIIAPFPAGLSPARPSGPTDYYRHHCHISVLSMPQSGPCWDIRQQRYAIIQNELRKLRAGA